MPRHCSERNKVDELNPLLHPHSMVILATHGASQKGRGAISCTRHNSSFLKILMSRLAFDKAGTVELAPLGGGRPETSINAEELFSIQPRRRAHRRERRDLGRWVETWSGKPPRSHRTRPEIKQTSAGIAPPTSGPIAAERATSRGDPPRVLGIGGWGTGPPPMRGGGSPRSDGQVSISIQSDGTVDGGRSG